MRVRLIAALVPLALAAAPVQSQVFTPTYDSFGALTQATFGGNGIPNHAVAQSVFDGVTLGLTATQRFSNPVVTDNGAGTYYATLGADPTAPPAYARWNFNFFIGGQNAANYSYVLRYDFDPAQGTLVAAHGSVMFGRSAGAQNSWNLGMGFLDGTPFNAAVTPPTYPSFSNSVDGEYTFALLAYDANNVEVDRVAIAVTTTPEPASLTLMASGLLAFGLAARRRRKA